MAERGRRHKWGWLRTARNIAILEGYPHLAGILGTITIHDVFPMHSKQALAGAAVAINVAMWLLMYGPNTRGNIHYLTDTGASITIGAKIVDQLGAQRGDTARSRQHWTTLAHRVDLTIWEAIYGIEALTISAALGADAALQYWGSAGIYGLAKNIALLGLFHRRERTRSTTQT